MSAASEKASTLRGMLPFLSTYSVMDGSTLVSNFEVEFNENARQIVLNKRGPKRSSDSLRKSQQFILGQVKESDNFLVTPLSIHSFTVLRP